MMIPPFVQNLINSLTEKLDANAQALNCIWEQMHLNNRYNAFEHGKLPEQDDLDSSRNLYRVPFVEEFAEIKPSRITKQKTIDVRGKAGYLPRDGSIANIGEDVFAFIVHGQSSNSNPTTVLPGTNYVISTPVYKITILELDGNAAPYQLFLN